MTVCRAAVSIGGDTFGCELSAPHPGIAHHSKAALANWCSDGEARKHQGKPVRPSSA